MKATTLIVGIGILFLIGGVLALANPFAASLAVTQLVGAFFMVGGAIQLWVAFRYTMGDRIWNGLFGLLGLVVGVWLLANPLEGVVSLTLVVGALFFAMGLLRLLMAWLLRTVPAFWLLLLSGAASVVVGVFILAYLPEAAAALLGLLLGVQLLFDGIALIALGLLARRFDK